MIAGLWILAACGAGAMETAVETAKRPSAQEVNGYTNASYTEANANLIGTTNRLQLVSVYSTWWSTWRANQPIVNRLNEPYSDQIDMFYLDIDAAGTSNVMADYKTATNKWQPSLDICKTNAISLFG